MRARCIPGGYWTSWPVTGKGSTSDTLEDGLTGPRRTVQSTRSWKRRRLMAAGWIRKPQDARQHLGQRRVVAAGGDQEGPRAEHRPGRVRRSWARAKGPKALSLAR